MTLIKFSILLILHFQGVDSIFNLLELDDDERNDLLKMTKSELADVARFCNNYPSIEVEHEVSTSKLSLGESIQVNVKLERENDENGYAPSVVAPFYPLKHKEERWWLVVGDVEANTLCCIKKIGINVEAKATLEFTPTEAGKRRYKLYFMCDSYLGADQEFDFNVRVEG